MPSTTRSPPERRLELRIGVNLGDVIVDGDNIFGDGINIAARLQALAKPGTVCISQTVYEQVKNKLDFRYRPLGSHRVKNIVEPVRAYAVEVAAATRRRRRRRWPPRCRIRSRCEWWPPEFPCGPFEQMSAAPDRTGLVAKPVEVATLASPARLEARPSVAVLPFKNLSGDAAHDFFSDGITEDVICGARPFFEPARHLEIFELPIQELECGPRGNWTPSECALLARRQHPAHRQSCSGRRAIDRGDDGTARLVGNLRCRDR